MEAAATRHLFSSNLSNPSSRGGLVSDLCRNKSLGTYHSSKGQDNYYSPLVEMMAAASINTDILCYRACTVTIYILSCVQQIECPVEHELLQHIWYDITIDRLSCKDLNVTTYRLSSGAFIITMEYLLLQQKDIFSYGEFNIIRYILPYGEFTATSDRMSCVDLQLQEICYPI